MAVYIFLYPGHKSTSRNNFSIAKPTRCTIFEFIEYHSTCFGRSFRPSSGVQDCNTQHQVYVIQVSWLLVNGHLVPANKQPTNLYDIYLMLCVTVLNSWWWTERPSETCKVIFNKLENCASSWFYYRNMSRCTVPWTSNHEINLNEHRYLILTIRTVKSRFKLQSCVQATH